MNPTVSSYLATAPPAVSLLSSSRLHFLPRLKQSVLYCCKLKHCTNVWQMMGCFPKPVHMNATASIRAYPGLLREEDVRGFGAASRQLCSGLNEACGEAETFAFLGALLMTVEKLKTSCLSSLYDLNHAQYAQNGG